ncbi:MAG: sigma-70 family RNA polymerase sigma factor [Oscillospiraceae bacterium]|nr:sigma-70 family RNA polymerase sigma factor [Oscillospiraceae bacterium]
MTDMEILDLYRERSESAITETAKQYNSYCIAIAMNILHNREDAEECVNDTYFKAWNSIPPQCPVKFSSFLGRITRNLSINKYNARKAKKRNSGENALLLSELETCLPSADNVEKKIDEAILGETIDRFLSSVTRNERVFFVRRYWYNDSVADIAKRFSVGESKVAVSLFRTRKKLKAYLEKEGI